MTRSLQAANEYDANSQSSTATWDPFSALSRNSVTPDEIYESSGGSNEIFQFEAKRAGESYDRIFNLTDSLTNVNNSSEYRDTASVRRQQIKRRRRRSESESESESGSGSGSSSGSGSGWSDDGGRVSVRLDVDSNASNVDDSDAAAFDDAAATDSDGSNDNDKQTMNDDSDLLMQDPGDIGLFDDNVKSDDIEARQAQSKPNDEEDEFGADGGIVEGQRSSEELGVTGETSSDEMPNRELSEAEAYLNRYKESEDVEKQRGPLGALEVETEIVLPVGYLEKEGVVIGSLSVFVDVHVKEYIVFLSDDMIQAFLVDPGRFRAVANRSKCEIEVTRRVLNRKMGQYRWLKYLVVVIRGPSYSAIDQCDRMMIGLFPPYKNRKPYGTPASVSMYLKEDTPDNSELFFNYQRTGPSLTRFGEIPLKSPFAKSALRPLEDTPWKRVNVRQQWGVTEPLNIKMETVHNHVYPERGADYTTPLDHQRRWKAAAEFAVDLARQKDIERSQAMRQRRDQALPLTRKVNMYEI